MKPFPKLRPTAWDALVVLCVAALAVGLALFQWRGGQSQALTAVVSVDGEEVDRFSPEDLLERPRTYTNNGYTLTVVFGIDYEGPARNAMPPLRGVRSPCSCLRLPYAGLRSHRNHCEKRAEHRLPPRPGHRPPGGRNGGRRRRGRGAGIGGAA